MSIERNAGGMGPGEGKQDEEHEMGDQMVRENGVGKN